MMKQSVDKFSYKIALVALIVTAVVVGSIIYFNPTSFRSSAITSTVSTSSSSTPYETNELSSFLKTAQYLYQNPPNCTFGTRSSSLGDFPSTDFLSMDVVNGTRLSMGGHLYYYTLLNSSASKLMDYVISQSGGPTNVIYTGGQPTFFTVSTSNGNIIGKFTSYEIPFQINSFSVFVQSYKVDELTAVFMYCTKNCSSEYQKMWIAIVPATLNTSISPSNTTAPLTVVSVSLLKPYTPGGPTVEVILKNNATNSVASLRTMLTLSGHNYTYVFDSVSSSNPLLPNQDASQTETLIGAGFETNQTYPMEIAGTLQNGSSFDFVTYVTIVQYSNHPVTSESIIKGNGTLQLTMVLGKTVYSLGEPVNLNLTITNISNQTINFMHTGLDFNFRVYNGTNNVVYQWSNFKAIAQFIAIVPLHAGESRSANFTWLQTCNSNASVEGEPVSPGIYNIIGQTGPVYGLQTTPIQLTIVKP
jgi:hypothetical protein